MVWPLSEKKPSPDMPRKVYFKDGASFFRYWCKFGDTVIVPMQGIVALVYDSSKEFGTEHAVKLDPDGHQTATLKVASDDGGFLVVAQTRSGKGDRLKPDDLVVWVPVVYNKELIPNGADARFGWTGLIIAKVEPEIDLTNPYFEITSKY